MILGTLILFLLLFSFLHFIVDGILAPSELMLDRLRLLQAVQELDSLHNLEQGPAFESARSRLRQSCHSLINQMPRFTLTTLTHAKLALGRDQALRARATERAQQIAQCGNADIKRIDDRLQHIADNVLFVNSAGWAPYLVPPILALVLLKKARNGLRILLSLPEPELRSYSHSTA